MAENEELIKNERELPYSIEAELSVIGSVLSDTYAVGLSAEVISPEDFYIRANREIYSAVMELFNENKAIDIVTVSDKLAQGDKLDAIGGMQYLAHAATSVPTTKHITYYSNIIKEKAMLRKLISAGNAIVNMAYSASDEVPQIMSQSEKLIFDVASGGVKQDIVPISELSMDSYTALVENSANKSRINGVDTGFYDLNDLTGGFHGGELILIAGRPGMGKSSFAVNIAEHAAIRNGETVAIFNLEMPKIQIVNRILCSQARINSSKLRTGDLLSEDWSHLSTVLNSVFSSPIYIDDTPTISVSEIRAKCRRLKHTKKLSLIIIDYLQLMQSQYVGRNENRQNEIADISRSLKILAKELDIPVVALSQLSRASESRSDKRPMLSDLRESGAIEQDADMVMFIYRDEYYRKDSPDKGLAECIVAKNRNGETRTFKLKWHGEFTKFDNYEPSNENEQ